MEKQPPEDSRESQKATSSLMSNKRRSEQERKHNTTGLTNIGGTRNSQITIQTNESDNKMYRDDGLECQKVVNQSKTPEAHQTLPENQDRFYLVPTATEGSRPMTTESAQTTESRQAHVESILRKIRTQMAERKADDSITQAQVEVYVDPTPDLIEGIFYVNQTNIFVRCCTNKRSDKPDKIEVYDYRSLYLFHFKNRFRQELVNFTSSSFFENFIILLIFVNTVVLTIYEYDDRDNERQWNQTLEQIGEVFTILFAIEMVLKILAQGLIFHRCAYLKDAWNWLDTIVVVTGILEMMNLSWFKVRALRTLRVLRPLRSIKAFPKMRKLVSSLIGSVDSLLNAVAFMLFIFMLFGILGIQQFEGTMYRRCRYTEFPLDDGTWPYDPNLDHLCSKDGQGLMECPPDRFCKEPKDAGLPASIDDPHSQYLIMYGIISFDNLAWAMLSIFQMITLEGWTIVMYNLMDSNIAWMAVLFCVLLVIMGSFFLLNVILAVLADALNRVDKVNAQHDLKRLKAIQESLDRAQLQKEKQQQKENEKAQTVNDSKDYITVQDQNKSPVVDINSAILRAQEAVKIQLHANLFQSVNQPDNEEQENEAKTPQDKDESQPSEFQSPGSPVLHVDRVDDSQNSVRSHQSHSNSQEQQALNLEEQGSSKANIELRSVFQERNNRLSVEENEGSQDAFQSDITPSIHTIEQPRYKKNCLYHTCYKVCTHWAFTLIITLLIIANTAALAMDKYPEDEDLSEVTSLLNNIFTYCFILEMVIKLIGLGFREYSRDSFNIFDAIVVVLSIVDMIITASSGSDEESGVALTAFRGARLIRVFKLARSWTSFRQMLSKILVTLKDVSTFTLLLVMFMFIFTLLGMELFGHKVKFDDNDVPIDPETGLGESPRPNFDNVGMGFTSIFAIAIGDDWNLMMAMAYRAEGFIAILFYPFVFVFMNLILLNLFLAILLSNFETSHDDEVDHEEKSVKKAFKKVERSCKKCCLGCKKICPCFYRNVDKDDDDVEVDDKELVFRRLNTANKEKLNSVGAEQDENSEGSSFLNSESSEDQQQTSKNRQSNQSPNNRKDESRFSIIYEDEQENSKEDSDYRAQKKNQKTGMEKKAHSGTMEDGSLIKYQKGNAQHKQSDSPRQKQSRSWKPNNQSDSQAFEKKKTRVVPMEEQKIDLDQQQGSNEIMVQQNIGEIHYNIGNQMKKFTEEKVISTMPLSQMNRRRSSGLNMSIQEKQAVKRWSKDIPEEYQPRNFLRIYKQQHDLMLSQIHQKDTITAQQRKDLLMSTVMIANTNKIMTLTELKRQELIEKHSQDSKLIKLVGRSLFIFSKTNWLRRLCYHIVKQSFYDTIVLVLITISTFLLTLDNPNLDEESDLMKVLRVCDIILTTLFTLECIINVILFGFICNGKKSYARDPWNVMDLIIVFFSIFTLVLQGQDSAQDLSILKIFRMLRVLRPLRFLKRNFGLKIQVISLMKAIPGIGNLLLISMLILMLFGIQAVTLLKGALHYCNTTYVPEKNVPLIKNQWDCWNYGGEWVNNEDNFDNVANAMISMFGMITTEGWLDVMFAVVDSNKIDLVPERNLHPGYIVYFGIFMIVGSLFILNLFVGVVINTFNVEKEKLSHNGLMTVLQNEYVEALIKCYNQVPKRKHQQSGNKLRDLMARFAQHDAFNIFIFSCICLNTVCLAISWYGMDQDILQVLEIINYIFTFIYSAEMIIKVFAFGKSYFNDGWNVFDFLIVLSAWFGIILLQVFSINVGSITTIIRSFRIARVLKIIKRAKNLQQIFQTFILAIPELVNVGALLVLFLFLFAVLGVSLFAEVKLQENMNRHANFENFYRASLTLLRVATGEGWVGIMYDAGRQPSVDFTCIENQSFESKQEVGIQGCGSTAAYIYFITFILMVSLVFLNLFIAIILEGFAASATEQNLRVGDDCINTFLKHWQKYDPLALGFMEANSLEDLILDLVQEEIEINRKDNEQNVNFNLRKLKTLDLYTQWQREIISQEDKEYFFKDFTKNKLRQRQLKREMKKFLMSLQIPLYYSFSKVNFHDTLNAIIRRVYFILHELEVENRKMIIEKKLQFGESLKEDEVMKIGSQDFWHLNPKQKEIFMEMHEKDFQKVINRLENKNNQEQDPPILKLNQLRRLRKRAGQKHQDKLDMFEGVIYDSSHIIGLKVIVKAVNRRRKNKELKLLRSTSKEGPPTARNTQRLDTKKKDDDDITQVFQSESKPLKSALSKYDGDKNDQLLSNDTLGGLERQESDQPKLFDQSFKIATDDDKQNDGREPKLDSATNSQGMTQFSNDIRSTKNRFSLMKELEETMDEKPNTSTKHDQLNDSILKQNMEMDIIDEEVKQSQQLSLLSGIVSMQDKGQAKKIELSQITPKSKVDLESTEEQKETRVGVNLKLKSSRSASQELNKNSIPNHSVNDNSQDLMAAAQEELLLASQDQDRRNVRSSQEENAFKSNLEHSYESRNQEFSISSQIQQPQESRMSSTTYGQFNSKFRSQRNNDETPLENRTPLQNVTSKSQRVSVDEPPKDQYNIVKDAQQVNLPGKLAGTAGDSNNYQDTGYQTQAGIATRNLNTFKRETQRTPMRESRVTQQVGSNIIGSKPSGLSNSQPKKSSAPEAVRGSQSQQDALIHIENMASSNKRQMHKTNTAYGLFPQQQSNPADDTLIKTAQQHLQQNQQNTPPLNQLTASSYENKLKSDQNYSTQYSPEQRQDRFRKSHERSSTKLNQNHSKANLVVTHDQTWFQGSPKEEQKLTQPETAQSSLVPKNTRNRSSDQQVDDYPRSINQSRYGDGTRKENMAGKNVGEQQFMKTQLNFIDPEAKLKVNNSVTVPPQPQINNSLNFKDQRMPSRSSTLKKLQDQGIVEVTSGIIMKPQPFIDENPLPTLRQRATIEQITSPENPQLTQSIHSQNSVSKRKKKNQNYDSEQKAGSRSSKNKSSIGSLNSVGEPKKKKREQSRLTKIMNVYKNESMEDRH